MGKRLTTLLAIIKRKSEQIDDLLDERDVLRKRVAMLEEALKVAQALNDYLAKVQAERIAELEEQAAVVTNGRGRRQ